MTIPEIVVKLKVMRAQEGYGKFDQAMRIVNRERLQNPGREKRKRFPRTMYLKLYAKQEGMCACGCGQKLLGPPMKNHVDHIDNARQDFNHTSNLRLLLPRCNLQKGAKTLFETSKEGKGTILEQLG